MTYTVLTCDGYRAERTVDTLSDAIAACRELELVANDGFARLVCHDGRLVADVDGPWTDSERYVDAATQTGMYDRD